MNEWTQIVPRGEKAKAGDLVENDRYKVVRTGFTSYHDSQGRTVEYGWICIVPI